MTCIRSFSVICKVWGKDARRDQASIPSSLCSPTRQRRSESLSETPFDTAQLIKDVRQNEEAAKKDTVLYLAYGSNLSAETFKGSRGIKPLSQVNVLVPSLTLTFDLPGIPYSEPCFANTRHRNPSSPSLAKKNDYHKDHWHKGLVGVVYEVTKEDYATIIATEGGGSGYQDIVVACYELPAGSETVDPAPHTASFKAHTLFAPYVSPGEPSDPCSGGRISRPDPSYAQPSARYLKLITDGAEEHSLPDEYRSFLYNLRPYTITRNRQRLGQFIFLSIWMPIVLGLFAASKVFVDDKGRLPGWMIAVSTAVFRGVWVSYDRFFRGVFGDGERTQHGDTDEETKVTGICEKQPLLTGERILAESEG